MFLSQINVQSIISPELDSRLFSTKSGAIAVELYSLAMYEGVDGVY